MSRCAIVSDGMNRGGWSAHYSVRYQDPECRRSAGILVFVESNATHPIVSVINIPRKLERFLCLAFVLSPCVEGLFLFRNHLRMFSRRDNETAVFCQTR